MPAAHESPRSHGPVPIRHPIHAIDSPDMAAAAYESPPAPVPVPPHGPPPPAIHNSLVMSSQGRAGWQSE